MGRSAKAAGSSLRHHSSTSRSWRWRRCPRCFEVHPAGDFEIIGTYRPGWNVRDTLGRSCPSCRFVGRTNEFVVVRESHA
jgi:NAD-dependent dihydropyrimidine dehydrogenase PreA subunit